MSALMAERRDWAEDPRQASLFDALAPPPQRAEPAETPREQARIVEFPVRREPPADVPADADETAVGDESLSAYGPAVVDAPSPAAEGASAIEAEIVVEPEGRSGETSTPRAAGAPLAGPTLDDVMSRVWEGLVTGLPAACPVCHAEVLPSRGGPLRGRCTSCDTTID